MFKKTRQKKAILDVLAGTRSHPTADWVYRKVKTRIPSISLGTVYRNLRILSDNGMILELNNGNGLGRFDAHTGNHYHFKCNLCGEIIDIDEPVDVDLDNEMNKKTGLNILYHRTDFYGLCRNCEDTGIISSLKKTGVKKWQKR